MEVANLHQKNTPLSVAPNQAEGAVLDSASAKEDPTSYDLKKIKKKRTRNATKKQKKKNRNKQHQRQQQQQQQKIQWSLCKWKEMKRTLFLEKKSEHK